MFLYHDHHPIFMINCTTPNHMNFAGCVSKWHVWEPVSPIHSALENENCMFATQPKYLPAMTPLLPDHDMAVKMLDPYKQPPQTIPLLDKSPAIQGKLGS